MRCEEFHHLIERWSDADLPSIDRTAGQAHLASCAECRGILAAWTQPEPHVDLTAAVLRQTTGTACQRVEAWTVQSEVPSQTAAALERHRSRCVGCRQFAEVVAALDRRLPDLAEVVPPADFVDRVLQSTTLDVGWTDRWLRQVNDLGAMLAGRPRLSVELAYVFTVLLVMLAAPPSGPLRGVLDGALGWLQTDAKAEVLVAQLPEFESTAVGEVVQQVSDDLAARREQVGAVWICVGKHSGDLGSALWDGDSERVEAAFGDLGQDARQMWQGARRRLPEGEPKCGDD